jgi:hypothetical protein
MARLPHSSVCIGRLVTRAHNGSHLSSRPGLSKQTSGKAAANRVLTPLRVAAQAAYSAPPAPPPRRSAWPCRLQSRRGSAGERTRLGQSSRLPGGRLAPPRRGGRRRTRTRTRTPPARPRRRRGRTWRRRRARRPLRRRRTRAGTRAPPPPSLPHRGTCSCRAGSAAAAGFKRQKRTKRQRAMKHAPRLHTWCAGRRPPRRPQAAGPPHRSRRLTQSP